MKLKEYMSLKRYQVSNNGEINEKNKQKENYDNNIVNNYANNRDSSIQFFKS